MHNWFVRQYEDIRGNLKWSIIAGLLWLLNKYGKKMLDLVPHIPGWLTDVILFLFFITVFVWAAKRMTISQESKPDSPLSPHMKEIQRLKGEVEIQKSAAASAIAFSRRLEEQLRHPGTADVREVKISKLSDQVEHGVGIAYPLKLRMQLRNDSDHAVDVQLKEYRPNKITLTPKGFPLEVLQLRIGNAWLPIPEGISRIAVLPKQQFQAWIGLNESQFNKPTVESHRGQIGALILLVDGKDIELQL